MKKTTLFLKWTFAFSVLAMWTFLVVQSIAFGSAIDGDFSKDFNVPIYSDFGSGVEKMSSSQIIDYLFNHDFSLEKRKEIIPMKDCSIRASGGMLEFEEREFSNSKLSFNVNHLARGEGSLTSQDGRERLSLTFTPNKIEQTDLNELSVKGSIKGKMNKANFEIGNVMLKLNKSTNTVSISGNGLSASNMNLDFSEGCFNEETEFIFLNDNGELEDSRDIEEVRSLLNENPELMDAYEGLGRLFTDYWWVVVSGGAIIVS